MKISFFGASITQQKNGYVDCFKALNSEWEVSQHGYGGMYITDAGICFIDDVLIRKPEHCFLDWFSSGCYSPNQIKLNLDAIVEKLFSINCHPIFLFFYRKDISKPWFDMFDYLKQYALDYNINFIDLTQLESPGQYLRDNIHTNDLGAKKYGFIINEQFKSMQFNSCTKILQKNKFSNINCLDINIVATKFIELKSVGCSSVIGVLQNIGPYTEDVICINKNQEHLLSIKDKWSERYERNAIKLNIENVCGNFVIKIPEDKKLVWQKLFYIGDNINLVNYE